jgi:hypothetical protein
LTATLLALALAAAPPCAVDADCAVGTCDGGCHTLRAEMLFPAARSLETIALAGPPNLSKLDAKPGFQWVWPIGADLVAVAVFRHPPLYRVDAERISNFDPGNVAWAWESNLGSGPGSTAVSWGEGRTVRSGPVSVELTGEAPAALEDGVYFWAVWGWSGDALRFRSEVRAFYVGRESLNGKTCGSTGDCAGPTSTVCQNQTCVLTCASDEDCFAGEPCDLALVESLHFGICRAVPPCPGSACGEGMRCVSSLAMCTEVPTRSAFSCGLSTAGGNASPAISAGAIGVIVLGRRRRKRTRDR